MQNAEERQRLLKQYGGDQPAPLTALLKCAGGILTLLAIAAGPWLVLSAGSGALADGHPEHVSARGFPNSMAESRRIYEERRQRHQGDPTDHNSARTLSQPCPGVQVGALRTSGSTPC
jgi:hypothetical protein